MTTDAFLDDTIESAPVAPRTQRSIDAAAVRKQRDGGEYRRRQIEFRAECARYRDPQTGIVGKPCWLCNEEINYQLRSPHPQSFTLDHIITVKDNPALLSEPNNFAAAHRTCNEERGTDAPKLDLGECSEIW